MTNFETILVLITSIAVLISNTPFNSLKWMPFSIFVVILGFIIIQYNNNPNVVWRYSLSFICIIYLLGLIQIMLKSKGGRKTHRAMIFQAKEEINYEYVFQTLFNRPSTWWLSHLKTNKSFDPYTLMDKHEKKSNVLNKTKIQEISKRIRKKGEERLKNQEKLGA